MARIRIQSSSLFKYLIGCNQDQTTELKDLLSIFLFADNAQITQVNDDVVVLMQRQGMDCIDFAAKCQHAQNYLVRSHIVRCCGCSTQTARRTHAGR